MSDKTEQPLVNCGECVHLQPLAAELSGEGHPCIWLWRDPQENEDHPVGICGPSNCPGFAPSPLARIAEALERLCGKRGGAEWMCRECTYHEIGEMPLICPNCGKRP